MDTIQTLEGRLKKETPAGEFDWRTATVNTLGEIGKEAVSVFKEVQAARQPTQMAPTSQQSMANPQQQIALQKLQNYIMQNIQKGVNELRLNEAQKALGLSQQEIMTAYNELVKQGWIEPKTQQQNTPPIQPMQPQPQAQPQQQPQEAPPQLPQPTLQEAGVIRERFPRDAAFLET